MRATAGIVLVLLAGCVGPIEHPAGDDSTSHEPPELLSVLAPRPVSAGDLREREGASAISPKDPNVIAVAFNERTRMPVTQTGTATEPILPGLLRNVVALSRDGGETWTRIVLPTADNAPPGSRWAMACWTFDPTAVIDRDGRVHATSMFIGCGGPGYGTTNGLLHAIVDERGPGEPNVMALGAGGIAGTFHDRQWTAYDPQNHRLGAAWTAYTGAAQRLSLVAVFSEDGGRTWTLPEDLDAGLLAAGAANYLVHAMWDSSGDFVVSAYGCDATPPGARPFVSGRCLWQFSGQPGGPWRRSEFRYEDCPGAPAGGGFGYANGAAASSTRYVGAAVHDRGRPVGVCVAASDDGGATWPRATYLASAAQPSLSAAPDGGVAVFHLALSGDVATPTLVWLEPAALSVRAERALGPAYDADTDDDGWLEHGDYEGSSVHGDAFFWMLTKPNQEGRSSGDSSNDLDIWGYRGAFART